MGGKLSSKFEKQRVIDHLEPEPKDIVPLLSRRSNRIFHSHEIYIDMIMENVKKIFLVGDRKHRDDPKIYNEEMSDINFEKWLNAMCQKLTQCTPTKYGR